MVTVCLLVLAGLAVGGYRRVARNHRVTQTFFSLFYSSAISNQLSNHNFGSTREKKWRPLLPLLFLSQFDLAPSITNDFIFPFYQKIITKICAVQFIWKKTFAVCFLYLTFKNVFCFFFRSSFKSRKNIFFYNLIARQNKWGKDVWWLIDRNSHEKY